jgi:hypothetical protein
MIVVIIIFVIAGLWMELKKFCFEGAVGERRKEECFGGKRCHST